MFESILENELTFHQTKAALLDKSRDRKISANFDGDGPKVSIYIYIYIYIAQLSFELPW
jgi:hypothetical protein